MYSPSLGESAEPAFERRNNKKHFTDFKLVLLVAPRDMPDLPTKETRKQTVIYPRQTNKVSNEQSKKPTHHGVFFNTKNLDLNPYASPEGAGRTPPRGDERRLLHGTLGAAMRLKALSQAPPEIARPMTTEHPKRNRKQQIANP